MGLRNESASRWNYLRWSCFGHGLGLGRHAGSVVPRQKLFVPLQLRQRNAHVIDGKGAVGLRDPVRDRHPDHLAHHVEHRTAVVPRRCGHGGLQEGGTVRLRTAADSSGGDRLLEADRTADGDDLVPNLGLVGIAERDGRQPLARDVQDRVPLALVERNDSRNEEPTRMESSSTQRRGDAEQNKNYQEPRKAALYGPSPSPKTGFDRVRGRLLPQKNLTQKRREKQEL